MAVLTDDARKAFDTTIAIGEYGTQLFWFNPDSTSEKFEYALPLVSGGEYGGDTETIETPELDLDYVAKISARTTLNDITLTSNYTKARYTRWLEILNNRKNQVYMEVFSDGSAVVYSGTAGRPTIQGGEVRQIETTIAPSNMVWVNDITKVTEAIEDDGTIDQLNDMLDAVVNEFNDITSGLTTPIAENGALPIDDTTIPSKREWAYQGSTTEAEVEEEANPANPSNPQ